jgi:acetyl-CoA carboxylase carboxyl transferase subunit alpha
MAAFKVPIIAVVIGEGGSGGALGIAVANKVLILEYAYYSVISPEGCAAILWKDRAFSSHAAESLKLDASQLLESEIVDEIIAEPIGGAHRDWDQTSNSIKNAIKSNLEYFSVRKSNDIVSERYDKFRTMGTFRENP